MAEKKLKKDMPGYAPLLEKYGAFKSRGNLAPEWGNFWAFYDWVMEQGWQPGAFIIVDWTRPIGPDNCWLKFSKERKVQEPKPEKPVIKGGYANKPCNCCPNEDDGRCVNYSNCESYRLWINKSWRQFNAYWEKHGDRRWLSQD